MDFETERELKALRREVEDLRNTLGEQCKLRDQVTGMRKCLLNLASALDRLTPSLGREAYSPDIDALRDACKQLRRL